MLLFKAETALFIKALTNDLIYYKKFWSVTKLFLDIKVF
jgi:hypothetical protein